MSLTDLVRRMFRRAVTSPALRFRLRVEGLEDRTTPSYLPVAPDYTATTHTGARPVSTRWPGIRTATR